jgi:hypothetical protein
MTGGRVLAGTIVMDSSYAKGGEVMALNAANQFKGSSTPIVVIGAADGYALEHDHGTATAGKVVARYSSVNSKNGANETLALVQVTATTNLNAVNATFIAFGQAY